MPRSGWVVGQVGSLAAVAVILGATGRSVEDLDDLPLSVLALAQTGLWLGLLGVPLWRRPPQGQRRRGRPRRAGPLAGPVEGRGGRRAGAVPAAPAALRAVAPCSSTGRRRTSRARPVSSPTEPPIRSASCCWSSSSGWGRRSSRRSSTGASCSGALLKRGLPAAAGHRHHERCSSALSHLQLLQLPGLVLAGAVFGVLAHRSGRLGPAIAAHVAFNMVTVVALLAALTDRAGLRVRR